MTVIWTLDYSEDSEDKSSCGFKERWYLLPTLHVSHPHPPLPHPHPSAEPSYLCLGQAA